MQIRFVGFQHVQSGEHMAAMGVFFLLQCFISLRITVSSVVVSVITLGIGTTSGYISPCRFYFPLDPTYASVSEHQPTAWSSSVFDFQILLFLFPAGLYFCFKSLSDTIVFIVMYGLTSMYFAGVMVPLIPVATLAVCLISAIVVSASLKNLTQVLREKPKVS
ncbi:hypothetical protein SAY87_023473 [Trapa incisa]|uniref:dolichyl-diphosphooligosaccharide--protein glycotransferase n=1 Tax=Trapa incisa TaxID=236973 RepID=A0AAN7KXU2_9MYRT|nr:hypothetical protein SAY87_023473 [Trapa incisa]